MPAFVILKEHQCVDFPVKVGKVTTHGEMPVYESVSSSLPNGFVIKPSLETYKHIAIDSEGIGYIYDPKNKEIKTCLGICEYIEIEEQRY